MELEINIRCTENLMELSPKKFEKFQNKLAEMTLKTYQELGGCSTSFDVIAAVRFDGQSVGSGKPGPVFQFLHERFESDVRQNSAMQTPVYDR